MDEVASTNVWYTEAYSFERSRDEYLRHSDRKNVRMTQLKELLVRYPKIIGAMYFNTDYTHGLSFKIVGEADRAIVNLQEQRAYQGFYTLYQNANHDLSQLVGYFSNSQLFTLNGKDIIIDQEMIQEITTISSMINKKAESRQQQLALVAELMNMDIQDNKIQKSLEIIRESYQ